MMEHSHPDVRALLDELSGDSTHEQEAQIAQWIAGDLHRQEWVDNLRDVLTVVKHRSRRSIDVNAVRLRVGVQLGVTIASEEDGKAKDNCTHIQTPNALLQTIASSTNISASRAGNPTETLPRSLPRSRHWSTIATSFVAVCVVLFGALSWYHQKQSAPSVMRVHKTIAGERSSITLVDGTRIVLGVASTLRYNPYITTGARDIQLEGEAFFDVIPNAERPFVVRTKNTTTRVLGTEFVVRGYPTDSAVRVVVASGKVAFDQTILTAGTVGTRLPSGVVVESDALLTSHLAWIQGQIAFSEVPLSKVVEELNRWYGVEFRIKDPSLTSMVLTTTFTNRAPNEVADAIATALRIRFERHGDMITFLKEGGL